MAYCASSTSFDGVRGVNPSSIPSASSSSAPTGAASFGDPYEVDEAVLQEIESRNVEELSPLKPFQPHPARPQVHPRPTAQPVSSPSPTPVPARPQPQPVAQHPIADITPTQRPAVVEAPTPAPATPKPSTVPTAPPATQQPKPQPRPQVPPKPKPTAPAQPQAPSKPAAPEYTYPDYFAVQPKVRPKVGVVVSVIVLIFVLGVGGYFAWQALQTS